MADSHKLERQHLKRSHGKPAFYCRRCYLTFEHESELDHHHEQRLPCIPAKPKFEERICVQKMEITKKRRGMSIVDRWNSIFTILFPQIDVPESPCKP